MPRITKVTTKTGDNGSTGLANATRLSKSDNRVHLLGEIDELNAFIGLSISSMEHHLGKSLLQIQHDLFDIGAEISQPGQFLITDNYVLELEFSIEKYNEQLSPLKEFILPGGSPLLAQLHICRTICRRCERTATNIINDINPLTYQYLNRLSDFFFVFARFIAIETKTNETLWQSAYSRKS